MAAMAEEAAPTTSTEPATGEPTTESLGDAGKKALNEERSARRAAEKAAADATARLKEIETAQMSEVEKAAARASELERTNTELSAEAARLRVAIRHQIAEEDMDLLGSGTEEQIEARAKRIAELRGTATAAPTTARTVEQLRPGATPASTALNGDPLLATVKSKLGIA